VAVAERPSDMKKTLYRAALPADYACYASAQDRLRSIGNSLWAFDLSLVPNEQISIQQPRILFVQLYGLTTWGSLFNDRQLLALVTFGEAVREVYERTCKIWLRDDYPIALVTYLALCLTNLSHYLCTSATWLYEHMISSFILGGNIPIKWDYAEANPFGFLVGSWKQTSEKIGPVIDQLSGGTRTATCRQSSATRLPLSDTSINVVVTDPPYYDQIPYAECADFFYVWLRRILGEQHTELFRTTLAPKADEIIEQRPHRSLRNRKDKEFYESKMREAFVEISRVVRGNGLTCVMFAHKSTTAWETLIKALLEAKLSVTASWPMHTERAARLRASNVAALASSVTLVCRNKGNAGDGLWDDVRQELKQVAQECLDFFWNQGIRGADFFISAIGPALSVFGKYELVTKLSGEEVTVGQFLDEVRSLVTSYALAKILKTTHTAAIDPESRFYVVWKWSYGDAKVPADESFKLSQALGMHTEAMWDRTGVLEKSGENVQTVPISKRTRMKNLGEPAADGTPASLIDVLHRLCAFREKGDTRSMAQFLGQSGQANNPTLWLVAQAISEILPDGDREKQLMQGLLNQREGLAGATQQRELF
jgi:adenine-specific DNA methylase